VPPLPITDFVRGIVTGWPGPQARCVSSRSRHPCSFQVFLSYGF